jgi:hypothetical protein
MQYEKTPSFANFYNANIEALQNSFQYIDNKAYRDFCVFMSSHPDVKNSWLQLMGFNTIVHLTYRLLMVTYKPEEIDIIAPFSGYINTYYFYEIMSDNVVLNLQSNTPEEKATLQKRKEALKLFSEVALAKLNGGPRSVSELLMPIKEFCNTLSLFSQSLNNPKHEYLFAKYNEHFPDVKQEDIEFNMFDVLCNNIQTCLVTSESLNGYITQKLFTESIRRRYRGQLATLVRDDMTLEEVIGATADSVAAVPTVIYYIAYYLEHIQPNSKYHYVIRDESLDISSTLVAVISRLLNDVGTNLLGMDDDQLRILCQRFHELHYEYPEASLRELLCEEAKLHPELYARLYKDALFGEFNLAFYFSDAGVTITENIDLLFNQISILRNVYQESLNGLQASLAHIEDVIQSPIVTTVYMAFMKFHQALYANAFQKSDGEYAI